MATWFSRWFKNRHSQPPILGAFCGHSAAERVIHMIFLLSRVSHRYQGHRGCIPAIKMQGQQKNLQQPLDKPCSSSFDYC
jgi:hypothetical protein